MRIVIAIDKFKGTCTGAQASKAVIAGIRKHDPHIQTTYFPIADGGEGFAAAMKYYLCTQSIRVKTVDALGKGMMATYQWHSAKKIAVIELAAASGLAVLQKNQRNPLRTSTYGTGLLIRHAIEKGARKIILGLGGSATNDGGMGIAYALGFRCLDRTGKELSPMGGQLMHINKIIPPKTIPNISFTVCCDVTNPLYGKKGAAQVYAAQKGASLTDIAILDKGLQNLSGRLKAHTGIAVAAIKGMGAAGGTMAFLYPYFKCLIASGADVVIGESKIGIALQKADLLITGEGQIDDQSLQGKVISRLVPLAQHFQCPVWLVCGQYRQSHRTRAAWKGVPILDLSLKAGSVHRSMQHVLTLLGMHAKAYFNTITG